jgi:hypothetical protein
MKKQKLSKNKLGKLKYEVGQEFGLANRVEKIKKINQKNNKS